MLHCGCTAVPSWWSDFCSTTTPTGCSVCTPLLPATWMVAVQVMKSPIAPQAGPARQAPYSPRVTPCSTALACLLQLRLCPRHVIIREPRGSRGGLFCESCPFCVDDCSQTAQLQWRELCSTPCLAPVWRVETLESTESKCWALARAATWNDWRPCFGYSSSAQAGDRSLEG